jgi:putative SOS response-associated peptidase YedK
MCGRYSLGDPSPLMRRFGLEEFAETTITPRFNVAPTEQIPIVIQRPAGRELRIAKWGFQPPWMKASKRPPPINARADMLTTSAMFRSSIGKWRCIIPADGFYEWLTMPGQKQKQPMHIRLKSGQIFGFAGLYTSRVSGVDGTGTAVIITTEPNELVEPIHNRMPAILLPELEAAWLNPELTNTETLLAMLSPYTAEAMVAIPVSTAVNTAGQEGAELIQPINVATGKTVCRTEFTGELQISAD